MSSASRTIELMSYFSPALPEIGLSQLCRLAGRDKATTHRHLQALEAAGLIEQNPATRHYRLGPALLQLARTRELTVPRTAGAQGPLQALADATGETTHISVLSGELVYPLLSIESPRHSTRVIIDTQSMPLHATASGICALAFDRADLFEKAAAKMKAFTPQTPITHASLTKAVQAAQLTGFAQTNRSFEYEVSSIAAPVFDQTGQFAGSVSVAAVATRLTPPLEHCIRENLILASREITRNWGGIIPPKIEQSWAQTCADPAPALP